MQTVCGNIELALSDGVMTTRTRDKLETALSAARKLSQEMGLMLL
jgi:hypothetical protein